MDDTLHHDAQCLEPSLRAWRRDFHRYPELAFQEHRTSAFVAARLRALGLEVRTGVGRTGVVGLIRSPSGDGPAVLLRADMDALPTLEASDAEYRSTVPGVMHACGHDGHTAMLLGAATLLASRRAALPHPVVLCFQPAEEIAGGALAMIEDGVLDMHPVGWAFGIHLWSELPAGGVHTRSGLLMASADLFTACITGRGGHGAQPHLAADPVVAAAQAVVALQAIVSRAVDPLETAVVSIGRFEAGSAPNSIPDTATLAGTTRAFSAPVRELLLARLRAVLEGCAAMHGCRAELDVQRGTPPLVNDPAAVAMLRREAAHVVGEGNVREMTPMTGGEDFAYFLERVPGAFAFLGARHEERGIMHPHHHSPRFDIDESVLPAGAELLARLALAAR